MSKVEKRMMELGLIRKRILSSMITFETFVEKYTEEQKIQVPVRLEGLAQFINEFKQIQSELELSDSEHIDSHLTVRNNVEERYCLVKSAKWLRLRRKNSKQDYQNWNWRSLMEIIRNGYPSRIASSQ